MDQDLYLWDPSGGQQSGNSFPSIHGSPWGSPGPILPLLLTGETGRGLGVSPTYELRPAVAGSLQGERKRLYTDDTGKYCRGWEHANAALTPQVSCTHCVRLPLAHRQQRADALAAAAEDDWLVQESYSVDQALDLLDPSGGQQSRITMWFPRPHPPSPPDGGDCQPDSRAYGFGCRADTGSPGPSIRHLGSAV